MSDLKNFSDAELEAESREALSSKSTQLFIEIEEEKLRRKGAPTAAEIQARAGRNAKRDERPRFLDGPFEWLYDRGPWVLVKIALICLAVPITLILLSAFLASAIPGCESTGGELGGRHFGCVVLGVDISRLVTDTLVYGYFGAFAAAAYIVRPLIFVAIIWGAFRGVTSKS